MKQPPSSRADYVHFLDIPTRWMDNDVYGHVNNVVYYSYFDTVVNAYLIGQGVLDYRAGQVVGLVVETSCRYFAPIAFPETISAGLRVTKIGTSSVRYEVGLFKDGQDTAVAEGYFVHVYVDSATHRPTSLPDDLQRALEKIALP